MQTLSVLDFAIRLGVGLSCGAVIGLERQWRARMAGLRTNALVAAGATLFVLYSVAVGDTNSPTRVASYVVSGIGFLGGGVVLRAGFNIRGLNTAATLWCSAAVGCLAASGHLDFAALATATVVIVHLLGRPLGRLIDRDNTEHSESLSPYQLKLTCRTKTEPHIRALLVQYTNGEKIILGGMHTARAESGEVTELTARLLLNGDAAVQLESLVGRLFLEPGIHAVNWSAEDETTPTRNGV